MRSSLFIESHVLPVARDAAVRSKYQGCQKLLSAEPPGPLIVFHADADESFRSLLELLSYGLFICAFADEHIICAISLYSLIQSQIDWMLIVAFGVI